MDRRSFLQTTAAGALLSNAAPAANPKMIGIQVGAVSFVDEGVEQVLDIFQQRRVDQYAVRRDLHLWARDRRAAGARTAAARSRQAGVRHGADTFHGGSYTRSIPQYYKDTVHPGFPRAGFRRLRRAGSRDPGGPQARHEDHLLVRRCLATANVPQRRAGAGEALRRQQLDHTLLQQSRTTGTGCWARWRTTRARTRSTASCGDRNGRARSPTRWARATAAAAIAARAPPASASTASARRGRAGIDPARARAGFQALGSFVRRRGRASGRWMATT